MACDWQPTSTRIGYHAIKAESTVWTAVKPTNFIRSESGWLEMDKTIDFANSKQNDRSQNIKAVPWQEDITWSIEYSLDANESPFMIYGALGSLSSADVSSWTDGSVYKHTIKDDNCLPSFTYEESVGRITDTSTNLQRYQIMRSIGTVFGNVSLSIEGGRVMLNTTPIAEDQLIQAIMKADAAAWSSVNISLDRVKGFTTSDTVNIYDDTPQNETDAVAAISTANKTVQIGTLGNSYTVANNGKVELTAQTPSYSLVQQLFASWHASIQFWADLTAAWSASSSCIRSTTLTIDNSLQALACMGSFWTWSGGVVPQGRTVSLEFTRSFINKTDADRYLQAREYAAIITIDNNKIVSATDTGQLPYKVVIKIPRMVLTNKPMVLDNNGVYEYTATCEAMPDSSAGYQVQFEVWNAKAGTYYTT